MLTVAVSVALVVVCGAVVALELASRRDARRQ